MMDMQDIALPIIVTASLLVIAFSWGWAIWWIHKRQPEVKSTLSLLLTVISVFFAVFAATIYDYRGRETSSLERGLYRVTGSQIAISARLDTIESKLSEIQHLIMRPDIIVSDSIATNLHKGAVDTTRKEE